MKILITGSSGQIGTNLAPALLARGDIVLGVDKCANAWTEEIRTEIADMTVAPSDETFLALADFEPDVIVHLAAWAKVHQLVKEPEKALENVAITFYALELARRTGAAIVFGSSREVYGDVLRHVTDESMADFVIAESPYSASKIAGEAFFSSYAKCYQLKTLVFRFSNVYGRYDNDLARMERVIPLFVKRIAAGEPIVVFGKEKMLDFTYVDDCVAGIVAGIDKLVGGKVAGQTINLAFGEGRTLGELVEFIEAAVGRKAVARFEPSQTGEVTRYVADISKAKGLLGYSPKVPLNKGIEIYVRWCRDVGFMH